MNFKDIVGQKEVTDGLKNRIENDRVGHAFIFCGPGGIGKRTVARAFAALLLCNERKGEERCGECQACRLLTGEANPDFKVIRTDGASIGVDEIRKLQGDVAIKPLYSNRKIYLIEEAEKMTAQAQNCLLKTLEEPPEYTLIILTTANFEALLETIKSRASRVNFKKNTPEEVRGVLEKKYGMDLKSLDFIVTYSDGNIGAALQLAGDSGFTELREGMLEILQKLMKSRLLQIYESYDFFEDNRDRIDTVFSIMLAFYRDLLVAARAGKENILINSDKKDIILNNASRFSARKLVRNLEVIEQTHKSLKYNANFQLAIEVMLMKLQEDSD